VSIYKHDDLPLPTNNMTNHGFRDRRGKQQLQHSLLSAYRIIMVGKDL